MTPQSRSRALPRITIVTPAFGDDEYLEATLRSVIFQDYPNLELIVIEDGTSSERRRILKKYEAHFSWQICPPATELCAALNMALLNHRERFWAGSSRAIPSHEWSVRDWECL